MKYQLEIEFPATSTDDFDLLIEVESALRLVLGDNHYIDGHDFGSGTMTIFILTDYPDQAFEMSREPLQSKELMSISYIGYRHKDVDENYIDIWPKVDNVARIVECLRRLQNEGGDGNFAIFKAQSGYYVQFAGNPNNPSLYAEAVSNKYLNQDLKLSVDQEQRLQTMG